MWILAVNEPIRVVSIGQPCRGDLLLWEIFVSLERDCQFDTPK
ncbi:hypothetical protein WH5701_00495 [Synechococcus sp. WH 5701]|nr:hypothetical protein WH5701_00495 [Synechococcus sp. WH 5701]